MAIATAIFGLGFGICVNRDDYLTGTLRQQPGIWAWAAKALGIAALACFAVVFALVVEHLARPAEPRPFTLRSLFVRFLLIIVTVVAVCTAMAFAYGPGQAIGAVVGALLLFAALRERDSLRIVFGVLAAIMLGLTLWGTQTAYQYACRHADEIVAAGCQLADQCRPADYYAFDRSSRALFGQEIDRNDPRVPRVLRKLGARRIWVDDQRVAVYVGEGAEFQISRVPYSKTASDPVWGFQGKGGGRHPITDRLSIHTD